MSLRLKLTRNDFSKVSGPPSVWCEDYTMGNLESGLSAILVGYDTRESPIQTVSPSSTFGWPKTLSNVEEIIIIRDLATKTIALLNDYVGGAFIDEVVCEKDYLAIKIGTTGQAQ